MGIGLGYPYLGVKYDFSKQIASELRWATGEGINVYAGRGYWNFYSGKKLTGFTGLEGGYISFDTLDMKGIGYEGSVFVGGEYFISNRLSFVMDFSPTFITLKSDEFKIDGIEWVTNLAVYYYFGKGHGSDTEQGVRLNAPIEIKTETVPEQKPQVVEEPAVDTSTETAGRINSPLQPALSPEEKQTKMRELFVAGQQEFKQEKYEQAIEKFAEVVKIEPKHQISKNNINRARGKIEDKNKLKIENYSATARNAVKQKKYKVAIQIYREAIAEFSHQISFYKDFADVYEQQNQVGLVADVYLACLEKNPDANGVRKDLALLYEEKMEKSAKLSFGKYLEKAGNHWEKLLGTEYDNLAKEHLAKLNGGNNNGRKKNGLD